MNNNAGSGFNVTVGRETFVADPTKPYLTFDYCILETCNEFYMSGTVPRILHWIISDTDNREIAKGNGNVDKWLCINTPYPFPSPPPPPSAPPSYPPPAPRP